MPSKQKRDKKNFEHILEELIILLSKLNITVKYDRGNFQGGLVKYQDNDYFYINRKAETETKINTIIEELKNLDVPHELITEEIKPFLLSNERDQSE